MTRIDAICKVRADFEAIRDKVIQVTELSGYVDNDCVDFNLSTPAKVRVVETPLSDLTHTVDEWMDPYWNLELVEPHPELSNARSLWMFGTSYNMKTDAVAQARIEGVPA